MVVCARCKKEMRCIKTGMTVRFREDGQHAFAGDMLECPECKATIAVTNANSYFDEGAKRATDWDVWMNADKGFTIKPVEPVQESVQTIYRSGGASGYCPM